MVTYNLDIFGGCEANVNWPLLPDNACLSQWFLDANQCHYYSANNVHECFGQYQFGGTFWICAGHATHHLVSPEKDPFGLGCWVIWSLQSHSGCHIWLIFCYCPCSNSTSCIQSVFAQHQCHFARLQWVACPRTTILDDLSEVIQSWRTAGNSIVLFADMNDNIRKPCILEFTECCNLLKFILSKQPGALPPVTFKQGQWFGWCLIDGVWDTPDVIISQSMYCSVDNSPGDHQAIIIDINLLAFGEPWFKITHPPGSWHLNCSLPKVKEKYIQHFEKFVQSHKLENKLTKPFLLATTPDTPHQVLQSAMEQLDQTKTEGMKYAEKRCHCMCVGEVQFSPQLNIWRQCHNLWLLVLKCKQGRQIKATTIRKLTHRCQVANPLSYSTEEALCQSSHAKDHYYELKPQHDLLHQDFLSSHLSDPSLEDAHHQAIAKMICLKHQQDMFWRIQHLKEPHHGASISQVETSSPMGTHIHSTKESVETALWQTLCHQFTKAHGSPLLHEPLQSKVGLSGEGPEAKVILEGTFECPTNTDEYTKLFIQALQFPMADTRHMTILQLLCPEDFISHWHKAKEYTSSSFSGLHFGHCKSATSSHLLAHLHARFTQLVFMLGISLQRYQSGLQVILERKG